MARKKATGNGQGSTKKTTGTDSTSTEISPDETQRKRIRANSAGVPFRYHESDFLDFKPVGPRERIIYSEISAFMEKPEAFPVGLIFLGTTGTGKTHLGCALLNHFLGVRTAGRYLTAMGAVRFVKETWGSETTWTEREAIAWLAGLGLLVIDEVAVQFGSDIEKMYLTEILNERYNNLKPTILVANLTARELGELLGDRVIDRFREGGKVLVFDFPSHRKGR